MPNRIIKESICTSENINNLLPAVEIFFYRLIVNCDDYGRFHASPAILRAKCFPWRTDDISLDDMSRWLAALVDEKLITIYSLKGKRYLQMVTWEKHQQIRARKSKFPGPEEAEEQLISDDFNCNQVKSNVPVIQSNPIVIQSESNAVAEEDSAATDKEITKKVGEILRESGIWSPTPVEVVEIRKWMEEQSWGIEMVELAAKEMALANSRRSDYIIKIFRRWADAKIQTVEEVEADKQRYENQQKKAKPRKQQGQAKPLQQPNEFGEDKFALVDWGNFGEGGN